MVECLTRDRGTAGLSLTRITVLCPQSKNIDPSLVLAQPRKTLPFISQRLLMGLKESNQTKPLKGQSQQMLSNFVICLNV